MDDKKRNAKEYEGIVMVMMGWRHQAVKWYVSVPFAAEPWSSLFASFAIYLTMESPLVS